MYKWRSRTDTFTVDGCQTWSLPSSHCWGWPGARAGPAAWMAPGPWEFQARFAVLGQRQLTRGRRASWWSCSQRRPHTLSLAHCWAWGADEILHSGWTSTTTPNQTPPSGVRRRHNLAGIQLRCVRNKPPVCYWNEISDIIWIVIWLHSTSRKKKGTSWMFVPRQNSVSLLV